MSTAERYRKMKNLMMEMVLADCRDHFATGRPPCVRDKLVFEGLDVKKKGNAAEWLLKATVGFASRRRKME